MWGWKESFQRRKEVGCPAWHLTVCQELCTGWDVAVIWCFCLFRVLSWISTWRPSLWARQSLRSMCWWDRVLELLVMLSHRQHCPVLSALSPLQDSCSPLVRYVSHAEFKDSVLPTLQKSLLRSPENVIESESVISLHCSVKEPKSLAVWSCWGSVTLDYAFGPTSARRIVWHPRARCGEATFVVWSQVSGYVIATVCTGDRILQLSARNNPELFCSFGINFSGVFLFLLLTTLFALDVNCGEGCIKMLMAYHILLSNCFYLFCCQQSLSCSYLWTWILASML